MSHHVEHDTSPELIFTRDFREYIRGRFRPGLTATIRYDPYRVVPPDDGYRFGDPERPVVVHLQCKESGPVIDVTLGSPAGIPDCIPSADYERSPKLHGEVVIPGDAAWVSVWFTYHGAGGRVFYDSNFGKNFRLRFYRDEIEVLQTDVIDDPGQPLGPAGDRPLPGRQPAASGPRHERGPPAHRRVGRARSPDLGDTRRARAERRRHCLRPGLLRG